MDGNAIFKDPYSAQPDIVSGVVLVWLESSGHLEVVFADFLLFVLPNDQGVPSCQSKSIMQSSTK